MSAHATSTEAERSEDALPVQNGKRNGASEHPLGTLRSEQEEVGFSSVSELLKAQLGPLSPLELASRGIL